MSIREGNQDVREMYSFIEWVSGEFKIGGSMDSPNHSPEFYKTLKVMEWLKMKNLTNDMICEVLVEIDL